MKVVRTRTYQKALKRLAKLGATDADVRAMEDLIAAEPRAGDVIVGGGGIRKLRFGFARRGKSGGGRSIYYAWTRGEAVTMLTAYAKTDREDLSADDLRAFVDLVEELTDGED